MEFVIVAVAAVNAALAGLWIGNYRSRKQMEAQVMGFLLSDRVRFRIAGVARSVAKDYLQERAQERGEVWEP